MAFKINISSNVQKAPKHDVQHSITANLNHVRNNYNHDRNPVKGTQNQAAKKYDSYHTLANAKAILEKEFTNKVKQHDSSNSVKKNPSRKYGSVKNYINKQKGNPYRFYVITLGTMNDKKRLLQLGAQHGKDKPTVYLAINQALFNYGKKFNHTHQNLKFITDDTNLFENGAFHAHLLMLATGKTPSGKPSLSYNTAMRIEYSNNKDYKHPMKDNRNAFKIMHQQEDKAVTRQLTKSFRHYINPNITFQLQRTHSKHTGIAHDKYIEIQQMNDKLRQLLVSANKQNAKLKAEANQLISNKDNLKYTKSYNYLADTANRLINSLVKRNHHLCSLVNSLQYRNRKLNNIQHLLDVDSIDILRGLPSNIRNWQQLLEIDKSYQQSNYLTALKGQKLRKLIKAYSHKLVKLDNLQGRMENSLKSNEGWYPEWNLVKNRLKKTENQLAQYQKICSPQLVTLLKNLKNTSDKSLTKSLNVLLENGKKNKGQNANNV